MYSYRKYDSSIHCIKYWLSMNKTKNVGMYRENKFVNKGIVL